MVGNSMGTAGTPAAVDRRARKEGAAMRYYMRQKCDRCMMPLVGFCMVVGVLVFVVRVIFS